MKRKNFVISEFCVCVLFNVQYRLCSPHPPLHAVPTFACKYARMGNVKGLSQTHSQFSERRLSLNLFKADWNIFIIIIIVLSVEFQLNYFNKNLPILYAKSFVISIFAVVTELAKSPPYIPHAGVFASKCGDRVQRWMRRAPFVQHKVQNR